MPIRAAAGISCACALLAIAASKASAQLVIGSTATGTGTPAAMYIDVTTGSPTTLWPQTSNTNVNGLAADNSNGKLYSNDAARLNVWNFGTVGTQPTFIAGIYRTDGASTFVATGVDSLGWAIGHLYGVVSSAASSLGQFRGIYEINTISDGMPTPHCVATPVYQNSFGTMALGGLDFDPALGTNGKFVVTSTVDASSNGGPGIGIYAIDALGDDSVVKIADFPAGQTDWDGLAIGGGKYWLTDYEPGTSATIKILPYDPVTNQYGTMFTVASPDTSNRSTGATWAPNAIPEPSTLGAVAIGCALLLPRSRRAA
jgi:hypothetical protein